MPAPAPVFYNIRAGGVGRRGGERYAGPTDVFIADLDLTHLTVHHENMNSALATAATAFEQTLHDLGFSGDEAELGNAAELGRRGALLAVSDIVWRRQLGPLLDSRQVREILGGRTRQAVSDLAKRRRLLALTDSRGRLRFPAFQFTPLGRPLPGLADILAIVAPAEVSSYTVASWFMTPQSLLENTPPAQWLSEGHDPKRAIEAARRTAARLGQ